MSMQAIDISSNNGRVDVTRVSSTLPLLLES